jgi:LemA protein
MTILWIVLGVVAVIAVVVIGLYNGLIRLKNRVEEAWSDIDVQLKRRYDLIPNLIETVKGYAKHEEGTFTKVTEARTAAMDAQAGGDPKAQAAAENMLSGALKSIFALSENYPDLKANENFLELQRELSDTENKIQASRRFYNGNVRDFNTKLEVFPTNMIAGMLGFKSRDFFEIKDEKEKENVKVEF